MWGFCLLLGDDLLCKYFCGLYSIFVVFFLNKSSDVVPILSGILIPFTFLGAQLDAGMVNLPLVLEISLSFFCRVTPLSNTCRTPVGLMYLRTPEEI